MREKLKIGLLLNTPFLPAWEYKIINEIKSSDYAVISLIIRNQSTNSITKERKDSSGSLIFRLHQMIDRVVFATRNSYFKKKDISEIVKDVPELKINMAEDEGDNRVIDRVIPEIKEFNLDIILQFGFNPLPKDTLSIPRYGVWSYQMDISRNELTGTSGYYEVVREIPVTVSELVVLKGNGTENRVIARAWESTCSYSINLNRNKLFWRASLFMPRVMKGIYSYGDGFLRVLEEKFKNEVSGINLQLPAPSLIPAIKNLVASFNIFLRKSLKKLFYTDPFSWVLLFTINNESDPLNNSYGSFAKIQPSKDKFWADPFVIFKNNKYYIFVEEFIYRKNKGHISVLELNEKGKLLNVQKIIDKPYHMSYPFIFEIENNYYMIPETGGNRTIDLYKCLRFPYEWVYVKTLMNDVNAVDTTLFYFKDKWWLFTVIDKIDNILDCSPELYLFMTDDIFSDRWISHPLNPVVSDIRTARPAGKIFINGNKIYRPSQDCSERYGRAFNINQILKLTETEYEESLARKVEPDWDTHLKGTHTFNSDKDFTIIDAYSFRKRI